MIEKELFQEGDTVRAKSGSLDVFGTIRGIVSEHIIDFWIVEVNQYDRHRLHEDYKYSCIAVPNVLLTRVEIKYPDEAEHDPDSVFSQASRIATEELKTLRGVVDAKTKESEKVRTSYLNSLRAKLDGDK